MHLIKLLFSQVGSTKSRDKSTLEAFSLASGILFSLQKEKRDAGEEGTIWVCQQHLGAILAAPRSSFRPPRCCCNFDMKICGCLALFFFGTQLWNCAKFSYAHDRKKERGEGEEYRYVRNIDGLPPCIPYPSLARHFLRLKSLHVQFSTDIQRYFVCVYVFFFCCCFLLFYLFAHFFFLCMPRVSETNSQHNFICRDFAYIWFWMFASSSSSSENISPRGGTPKYLRRPTRWLPTSLELLLLLLL